MNTDAFFLPSDQERIAFLHPNVGLFDLKTIIKGLVKQAEAIEDAIAGHRKVKGGARIQKTGSQPTQTAIAEGGVGLLVLQFAQIKTQFFDSLFHRIIKIQINQIIKQGPPLQEFGGKIMSLSAGLVSTGRCGPIVGQKLHNCSGNRRPELIRRCFFRGPGGFGFQMNQYLFAYLLRCHSSSSRFPTRIKRGSKKFINLNDYTESGNEGQFSRPI